MNEKLERLRALHRKAAAHYLGLEVRHGTEATLIAMRLDLRRTGSDPLGTEALLDRMRADYKHELN